jgi:hypothetical protein
MREVMVELLNGTLFFSHGKREHISYTEETIVSSLALNIFVFNILENVQNGDTSM